MNKKIIVGIAIAAVLIVSIAAIDALKTTLGDEAVELPGEETAEKVVGVQEGNEGRISSSAEANEYGGGQHNFDVSKKI